SRACVSRRIAYDSPEQPPPCTPTRRPPTSSDTPSFSSSARIFFAAFSVRWIVAVAGPVVVVVSVAIDPPSLVRGFFGDRDFDSVLLFPVADGGLDRVFREHRAVNLDRRERKFADDVRVLDRERLGNGLTLDPFGGERRTGNCGTATERLELGFL